MGRFSCSGPCDAHVQRCRPASAPSVGTQRRHPASSCVSISGLRTLNPGNRTLDGVAIECTQPRVHSTGNRLIWVHSTTFSVRVAYTQSRESYIGRETALSVRKPGAFEYTRSRNSYTRFRDPYTQRRNRSSVRFPRSCVRKSSSSAREPHSSVRASKPSVLGHARLVMRVGGERFWRPCRPDRSCRPKRDLRFLLNAKASKSWAAG